MTEKKPYGEIMDEMDNEAKYLPVDDIIAEVIVTMKHARVFISSREKMHPTGIELYDELLEKLIRRRYPATKETENVPVLSSRSSCCDRSADEHQQRNHRCRA